MSNSTAECESVPAATAACESGPAAGGHTSGVLPNRRGRCYAAFVRAGLVVWWVSAHWVDGRASAHRVVLHADRVLAPRAQADVSGDIPEELVRIKVAAKAVQVGAVLFERGDAQADGVGDVNEMARSARADYV